MHSSSSGRPGTEIQVTGKLFCRKICLPICSADLFRFLRRFFFCGGGLAPDLTSICGAPARLLFAPQLHRQRSQRRHRAVQQKRKQRRQAVQQKRQQCRQAVQQKRQHHRRAVQQKRQQRRQFPRQIRRFRQAMRSCSVPGACFAAAARRGALRYRLLVRTCGNRASMMLCVLLTCQGNEWTQCCARGWWWVGGGGQFRGLTTRQVLEVVLKNSMKIRAPKLFMNAPCLVLSGGQHDRCPVGSTCQKLSQPMHTPSTQHQQQYTNADTTCTSSWIWCGSGCSGCLYARINGPSRRIQASELMQSSTLLVGRHQRTQAHMVCI